jgi:transposase InsO family protein
VDLIEQLPPSNGHNSILVIVDQLTRMAIFIPTSTSMMPEDLAQLQVTHVFSKHGIPSSIVSDCGSEFTSRFWTSFTSQLGIKSLLSTVFHPETDGQTERVNQVLEQYLRIYCDHQQQNWYELLPLAQFAYNNSTHLSTVLSPFFANRGYHPCTHIRLNEFPIPAPLAESYAVDFTELHK